jgi:hypothetical protein
MRWRAGLISEWWRRAGNRRYDRMKEWHCMFVWRPLRVNGTWVWLERVERRYNLHWQNPSPLYLLITGRSQFVYRLPETTLERNERILRADSDSAIGLAQSGASVADAVKKYGRSFHMPDHELTPRDGTFWNVGVPEKRRGKVKIG